MGVLFFVAFLPRLTAVNRYVTPDELIWVFRSVQFREALLAGNWLETLTAGHPGIITTWLGALGIQLQLLLRPADTAVYDWITHLAWFAPDNSDMLSQLYTFLTSGRLLAAFVNSLGIIVIFWLTHHLYGFTAAFLMAFFLALDPLVIGLSGLFHVDGLITTFATISLLALALTVAEESNPCSLALRKRSYNIHSSLRTPVSVIFSATNCYAALAGFTAGLAVLTKSPALLLLPITALFLLLNALQNRKEAFSGHLHHLITQSIIWLTSFSLTILLLFPALWASPLAVIQKMSGNANRHIDEALRPTFFLGEMAFEHGPLFYPLTLAYRLSPIIFLGLLLGIILIGRHFWRKDTPSLWSQLPTWLFILWPLAFGAGISIAVKKFDRYALPAVPSLILLASLAWTQVAYYKKSLTRYLIFGLTAAQTLFLLWALPYPLTAVNPLLGGPQIAQKVMDVGWGEAVSMAGQWLADQPDVAEATAVTGIAPALAPFFPGQTSLANEQTIPQATYVIVSIDGNIGEDTAAANTPDRQLLHTIHFNGLDRARIYYQPNPQTAVTPLTPWPQLLSFGDNVQLSAVDASHQGENVQLFTRWQLVEPTNSRYTLKLTLQDEDGIPWMLLETPLLNEIYFYPEHWAEGERPQLQTNIPLPPGLPPGKYQVEIALFDTNTRMQLPVVADGIFQGTTYLQPDLYIAHANKQPTVADLNIPVEQWQNWLNGRLTFLGHSQLPATLVNGSTAVLDLFWQSHADLPPGLQLAVMLGDGGRIRPLSNYDSGQWWMGDTVHEKVAFTVPPQMLAGQSTLSVQLLDADEQPLADPLTLGQIEITSLDRLFDLPPDIPIPRQDSFGGGIHLRGFDLQSTHLTAGELAEMTLYWQTAVQPDQLITAFIHLIGPDGEIVAQSDQWPGGLPADIWAEGQVIIDTHTIQLPPDAPTGQYQVAMGLYTAVDGARLPAVSADGLSYADNQIILPVTIIVGSP
ncbi:MAG: hypothetical protein GY796_11235 [Chloroflexi bacterium]|nr:hypothetical protein [Chloroflexota bacterium]